MTARLIDMIASADNYRAHLQPIWDALPEEVKGEVRLGSAAGHIPPRNRICLTASWRDMHPLQGMTKFIYVEHGAGQSYGGDPKTGHWPDYSASAGSRHRDVLAYICPSHRVAKMWEHSHAFAVGCPRLDQYINKPLTELKHTVCFSFHWPCKVAPEADTVFWHYEKDLPDIVAWFRGQGWDVVSHVHPKWSGVLDADLARVGAPPVSNTELLQSAIVIADNTSGMYEAAALGRRVIALNSPSYRRDVHHGLRFWDAVPGIQVDDPEDFFNGKVPSLNMVMHSDIHRVLAESAADYAYAFRDGKSTQRAVDAILAVID